MAKVYIFLADGFEEIEALTVVDLLRRAAIDISMVSITGRLEVKGAHRINVLADVLFEEADFDDGELLVLPGGMPGTAHLMDHEGLDKLLRDFHKKKKNLAAICAAPSVLGSKGILAGKRATSYPGFESKLTDSIVVNQDVVEDGNVTTSRGLGTAIDFSLSLISRLIDKDTANRIADGIVYKHYL
ncbi:MAG: DJ-1/PfpI family protein [Clostridiales bacterium]|nr:DJ-1/PfpI family protein [Clostridiales bacterium]